MDAQSRMSFEELAAQADAAPFEGWDLAWIDGRWWEESPPWDYGDIARALLRSCRRVLDMGTGGGEFLLSLRDDLPEFMLATEAYPPNIDLARSRLAPLGVAVVGIPEASLHHIPSQDEVYRLPAADGSLDVVLCRHERLRPPGTRPARRGVGRGRRVPRCRRARLLPARRAVAGGRRCTRAHGRGT